VRPLGRGGRWRGKQIEGSAASIAAWNIDFKSSTDDI
jgi:hypothetical protein